MENTVLEKFHQGRQSLGTFSAIGSPLAVESLRYTGLDYVIVDTEHSPAGIESAAAQIAAAQGAGLTALARANEISRTAVLRLLDVGAQGVVVPCVETVEEVRELVRYAKFAPLGNRGFCPTRDGGWGQGRSGPGFSWIFWRDTGRAPRPWDARPPNSARRSSRENSPSSASPMSDFTSRRSSLFSFSSLRSLMCGFLGIRCYLLKTKAPAPPAAGAPPHTAELRRRRTRSGN